MAKQEISRLPRAILETADSPHRSGVMDDDAHARITLRHLGTSAGTVEPIGAEENRQACERTRPSRAVFARCLDVTTGYVSQRERGAKRPTGAAPALLDVIRKGIEVVP